MSFAATSISIPAGTYGLLINPQTAAGRKQNARLRQTIAATTVFLGHPTYGLAPGVGYAWTTNEGPFNIEVSRGDALYAQVVGTTTIIDVLRDRV